MEVDSELLISTRLESYLADIRRKLREDRIGISRSVSAGNSAATGIADYLEWFAEDPETDVGLCYVEGLSDGREFFNRVRDVTPHMPVVVVKGGATSGGQRAAASHTGSLASDDRVFDGMARQAGLRKGHGQHIDVGYHLTGSDEGRFQRPSPGMDTELQSGGPRPANSTSSPSMG